MDTGVGRLLCQPISRYEHLSSGRALMRPAAAAVVWLLGLGGGLPSCVTSSAAF